MQYNAKIKEDVLDNLFRVIICLREGDAAELSLLSNRTIHNSSVFQDRLSIDLAVLTYALSKIVDEKPTLRDQFATSLEHARKLLEHDQVQGYMLTIQEVMTHIRQVDENMQHYVGHVLNQARMKKGSKLYAHGISLAQSAAAMGTSQWELYNYVGKTKINDDGSHSVVNMRKRLDYARELFAGMHGRVLVFDTGPIITLTMNGLLSMLPKLKQLFAGDFLITKAVQQELIERPLQTKSHKLEAFHVQPFIETNVLSVTDSAKVQLKKQELAALANNTFFAYGNPIQIVHEGELECLALLLTMGGTTLVVDERTTRYLIETPSKVADRMEFKLHTKVTIDKNNYEKLKSMLAGLRTIRSVELLLVAFEQGLFSDELNKTQQIPQNKKQYFEGLVWGL
ncbi:MAG TPA: hypothetical protein VK158_04445, partial [Acidobacteriota bacterium]|nr:hypothetical protein [Acidobacteriota bacterium]